MKTITLSDEQYKTIENIVNEMLTQSNRATQYPLFVVQEDVKVYGDESWCNHCERKEESDGELCEKCYQLQQDNEDLPDYCMDCDSDCFVWYNWEEQFDLRSGVFFTAKACEEHIRLNHYHYIKPRSYGIGNWRNYEMPEVMKLLFTITGKEIPNWYM